MKSPSYIAAHIRRVLKDGGSAPLDESAQRFFKERVQTHGWRTADLRRLARRFSRQLLEAGGQDYLLAVADKLFRGPNLTEKAFAVLLLGKQVTHFGDREFELFQSWLARVTAWSDHDALVHYLIGPLIAAKPRRAQRLVAWTKSRNRWRRRAAAVALIQSTRRKLLFDQVVRISRTLLHDDDDMVQKGLGWLLRETAKAQPECAVPFLRSIRQQASRLVLRTACETLPQSTRAKILSLAHAALQAG